MIAPHWRVLRHAGIVWLGLACCGVADSFAGPLVPEEDRVRAADLADRARVAEAAGRHREATRLMQRAGRWDPNRIDDSRLVVRWLEPIEPLAAVRHADRLLELDPSFGLDKPAEIRKLRAIAKQSQTLETLRIAARLTQRLIVWGERETNLDSGRLAVEWVELGTLHYDTGNHAAASEAFDRVQRLALASPMEVDRSGLPWELMASVHLLAKRIDRTTVSIGLLIEERGESLDSRVLQGQVALRLGEPLTAIDHAERAAELAPPQMPRVMPRRSPYPLLVQAYTEINEAERSIDALEALRPGRERDTRLTIMLADQLAQHDRGEQGWERLRLEVRRLLDAIKSAPGSQMTPTESRRLRSRRRRLGEVFAAWLTLTQSNDQAETLLELTPATFEAARDLVDLTPSLNRFLASSTNRESALAWCDAPLPDVPPLGTHRARLTFALALGDNALAVRCLKDRVESLRHLGAKAERIDAEFFDACYTLADRQARIPVRDLMRWMRQTSRSDGSIDPIRAARHAAELAYATAAVTPETDAQRATNHAAVIALTDEVERLDTPAFKPALDAYYALVRAGEIERALATGERVLARWPTPFATERVSPIWHRGLVNSLARTHETRGAAGDANRALELDELLLDQNPADDRALNNLAYAFAVRGEGLARAERMARRAVELRPDDPNYRDTHGWTLHRLDRHGAARRVLRAGLARVDSETPKAVVDALREHLAAVDRVLGLAEEAEAETRP